MTLHEIGIKWNTDKSFDHSYCEHYEKKFEEFRNNSFNLLEVGILDGASLKMWEEFFPNANIIGADRYNCKHLDNERIKTYVADQNNAGDISNIPGNFDLIIDDGGHHMHHQQISFDILFKNKLNNGGLYVIEDLHTSDWTNFPEYGGNPFNTTLQFVKDLQSGTLSPNSKYFVSNESFEEILKMIDYVEIVEVKKDSITSFIKKK